ncbi:TPR repeat [Eubacterium ruminantium]|uniref:TPR repeat n=1 Tax=Eubacterium ruminantium TaxID=42322 RepID=A0A1T4K1B5_9FIRM|nr:MULTISPECIES: SEL1-like repeat protein [Eubacterium]MCR5368323.1 SEL1-like repeat protein [Eubacterium sp.]SCW28592.1 TPR repeat [Eubacterium ruminantium]SDM11231.1 TPR repeat [Eubacterium ruminantium]SJZ36097.1 TPR repeat [Eubacterium ruminantium]
MGFFSNLKEKIPFISNIGKKRSNKSSTELQYDKAMSLMENANGLEAVEILEKIADIGIMDENYKQLGTDCLKILGEFYETGKYSNSTTDKDLSKAAGYYEKFTNMTNDGEMIYKVAKMHLETQNFAKAITFFQKAAEKGIKPAYMNLGSIYENGLSRVDQYGNKSENVIPVDLDKAMLWYRRLADMGDDKAQAAYDRVDYASKHTDSIEFEEKDKIYSEISEKRKEKGKEPRFKAIDPAKLQYQYTYVHNQIDGYIHKLPKDWVKTINEETDEEYYAPNMTYKDFEMYVSYDSIPRDSKKTLENYLRYCNDAFDEELQLKSYITEYADGICTTFYHKGMNKGIVTFAFYQGRRLACMRFVCATMEIIEQYEEIIFETANSFAFVNPTRVSDQSLNRKDNQYYSEAIYCYYLEDYEGAMTAAKQALKLGSIKASYLLIDLYYDEDSPYRDIEKTISYAKQLFDATKDPDLAFLMGNIYDQQLKDYMKALNWYENAERLGNRRVPFYLGRFYYYGLLRTQRDGIKALKYFKQARDNGIREAEPYIKDIEELKGEDLQASVEKWERAVAAGSGATALKVALMKQSQIFYIATKYDIEKAFLEALGLGSTQAAYELGKIYQVNEADPAYKGEMQSLKYFEKAYDQHYDGFDKENLFKVIEYKRSKGITDEQAVNLYLENAAMAYVPAVDKLLEMVKYVTPAIQQLYDVLMETAETGDDSAIISMNKLEKAFPELVIKESGDGEKVIENKFFRLIVPRECSATINDDGGTIKIADSVIEFAVAELPVKVASEDDYLKIYKLIISEYLPIEEAEIIIANSRMIGSGIRETKKEVHSFSILLISSKNQYMFKLSSRDRRQLLQFKDEVTKIAKSLVESGEIYVDTEGTRKNIGLGVLLRSSEGGFLSIGKSE